MVESGADGADDALTDAGDDTTDPELEIRVMPQLTLYAEAQNLTDKGRRELVGPGRTYLQESAEYGRTFWFGVTANF